MRTTAVEKATLALLLAGATLAPAQQAPPPARPKEQGAAEKAPAGKSKLEEMLARALKDNPDIRVATAKLAEAEAELNRVRLQVMQKVVTLYHTAEQARADVQIAEKTLSRVRAAEGSVTELERQTAEAALAAAKAKLAAVEAEVPYLIGKQPQGDLNATSIALLGLRYVQRVQGVDFLEGSFDSVEYRTALVRPVQGPLADRLRKALDAPVSLRVTEGGVEDVLSLLREKEPALNVKFVPETGAARRTARRITMDLRDLPLGAALEYLEDSLPAHRIVVREYGLLITPQDRVPPGAVSLREFWKGAGGQGKSGAQARPAKGVSGLVTKVSPRGMLTVSIGSNHGLSPGNVLVLYRLRPEAKFLGTVEVVGTRPDEAVCRPVGRISEAPRPGDQVASQLQAK